MCPFCFATMGLVVARTAPWPAARAISSSNFRGIDRSLAGKRMPKATAKEPDKFLPLAPGTKKKIRDVMHLLYEHAQRYGWWPEDRINPISKVRQGGERQTHSPQPGRTPSANLRSPQATRTHHGAVRFCGGLRRGELTGSKWGNIDFVQKVFKPMRSIVKMG
jgi:integrase